MHRSDRWIGLGAVIQIARDGVAVGRMRMLRSALPDCSELHEIVSSNAPC